MATTQLQPLVYEMTAAEFRERFDRTAQTFLGMSGNEFIDRWKNGGFGPNPDELPGVMEVASLIPAE